MNASYASIALLEVKSNQVAISTLSVTNEECVLAGGWVLALSNRSGIKNVLAEKIAIPTSPNSETSALVAELNLKLVKFSDFLSDAKIESTVLSLPVQANRFNQKYLDTKATKLGHIRSGE
jgi:hypothetical protein